MDATVAQYLSGITDGITKERLRFPINAIADRLSSTLLSTGTLAIKTGGSAIVKTSVAYQAVANGVIIAKAAGDMAALVGTVTNAKFNVFVFYIDSAGTVTTAMGTEGATATAVKFPPTPVGKAMIGYVSINPTGTGNFVGGTTALDDATVVPTALYVNTPFPWDPNIILS